MVAPGSTEQDRGGHGGDDWCFLLPVRSVSLPASTTVCSVITWILSAADSQCRALCPLKSHIPGKVCVCVCVCVGDPLLFSLFLFD